MKQRVAVTWEMCGYIEVDADSIEEAMNMVRENPDNFSIPADGGDYVDGSFCLSTEDIDAMKSMCNF